MTPKRESTRQDDTASRALQEYLWKLGMEQDKDFLQGGVYTYGASAVAGQMLMELEV